MTLRRLTDEVIVARSDEAEGTEFRRHEGRDVRRIGLRRVARAVNHVIHGDQNAAALRLRIRCELHGVQEVDRPSAEMAVAGRMAPTITIGLSL